MKNNEKEGGRAGHVCDGQHIFLDKARLFIGKIYDQGQKYLWVNKCFLNLVKHHLFWERERNFNCIKLDHNRTICLSKY